mmetsp:Transcript_80043/g.124826  ORF Transcript_80043/g.124826 Transcript_80043/m.124826 type:complete len:82 (+) Transcript_80043:50-295(+)
MGCSNSKVARKRKKGLYLSKLQHFGIASAAAITELKQPRDGPNNCLKISNSNAKHSSRGSSPTSVNRLQCANVSHHAAYNF